MNPFNVSQRRDLKKHKKYIWMSFLYEFNLILKYPEQQLNIGYVINNGAHSTSVLHP